MLTRKAREDFAYEQNNMWVFSLYTEVETKPNPLISTKLFAQEISQPVWD